MSENGLDKLFEYAKFIKAYSKQIFDSHDNNSLFTHTRLRGFARGMEFPVQGEQGAVAFILLRRKLHCGRGSAAVAASRQNRLACAGGALLGLFVLQLFFRADLRSRTFQGLWTE